MLEKYIVGHDFPDLTLILDLPPEAGLERAASRGTLSRYDAARIETHETLRAGFLEIAEAEPDRCVLIDGQLPIDSVSDCGLAGGQRSPAGDSRIAERATMARAPLAAPIEELPEADRLEGFPHPRMTAALVRSCARREEHGRGAGLG